MITIDNQDISSLSKKTLSKAISVVPQNPHMFNRSILENIAVAKPDATIVMIRKAAFLAACDEFITGLSAGYDTLIGENGMKLSGGQRQRIAIARAILRDGEIFIFDEATSSLDMQTVTIIKQRLQQYLAGKIVISVSHDNKLLHTVNRLLHFATDGSIQEYNTLNSFSETISV